MMYFKTCNDIGKFKGYDKIVAQCHMSNWEKIFVDEYEQPIEVEDVILYLVPESIFDTLRDVVKAIDAGVLQTDGNSRNMVIRYTKGKCCLQSIFSLALEFYTDFNSYREFKEAVCEVYKKPLEELPILAKKEKSLSH